MLYVEDSLDQSFCVSRLRLCPSPALFRILLCIFHLLVVTLSNDSIYSRKQCPIYLVGKEERKKKYSCGCLPSTFFFQLLVISRGGSKLFDSAFSYLPNTKAKWMSFSPSQHHEMHLRKPLLLFFPFIYFFFFFSFFLTVHQPSFDPPECIKHSQIKRTWKGIYKQPHATFSLETPPFSPTLLSL